MWWFPLLSVALVLAHRRGIQRWWRQRALEQLGARRRSARSIDRVWRPSRPVDPADTVAPTLDALARSVAGGTGLSAAIAALESNSGNSLAGRLRDVHLQHRLGVPLAGAVAATGRPTDPPEVALALAAIGAAARHGGAQAGALDRTAVAVRQRRAVRGERRVAAAQARLSALVLVALPPVFALWNLVTSRRIARFMFTNPIGWICTLGGVALDIAGWRWMRRLVEDDR